MYIIREEMGNLSRDVVTILKKSKKENLELRQYKMGQKKAYSCSYGNNIIISNTRINCFMYSQL